MCASLLFQIFCIHFILNEVSSECDRMNGPSGLTACVHSPHYSKDQAAVCLPKRMTLSSSRHLTCRGENTEFCWFLCTTIPSHGGLSACQCDPNSKIPEKSDTLDIKCYLPTGDCSWFSNCLRKRINCESITKAEEKCKRLETINLSRNGKVWASMVQSCMQRNLLYFLYPQVLSDCKNVESVINWIIETCIYREIHSRRHYCDLEFRDRWNIKEHRFIGMYLHVHDLNPRPCPSETYIPNTAKLLVFYVENNTGKDKDTLATEIGEALSISFNWKKSGLSHESVAPENINKKGKSITIRIHLYSKTNDFIKANEVIESLKKYVENGKMVHLTLKNGMKVNVNHVISCFTLLCHSKYFSYQTRTIACTRKGGYCRDSSHKSLPCDRTEDGLCYQRKCCFTTNTRHLPCMEKGGWCQEESFSCDHYVHGTCEGTKKCCLPSSECSKITMIKRQDWKARTPTEKLPDINTPVDLFFIHHTDGDTCDNTRYCAKRVSGIQKWHIKKKYYDIGYSFLVGNDGNIYEGRGWLREGAHTYNYNKIALALAFIGNFNDQPPSQKAIYAAQNLIKCGVEKGYIRTNYTLHGHRDVSFCTECPGHSLFEKIQTWGHYKEIPDIMLEDDRKAKYNCNGDVTKLNPTGRKNGGIGASIKEIKPDLTTLIEKKMCYQAVGQKNDIHPAVIAAIASRESHAGRLLTRTEGWGDNNNAYGTMQCDVRLCPVCDKRTGRSCTTYHWDSCEHINMMTKYALVKYIKKVKENHPNWTLEQQLQGGVAAYDSRVTKFTSWENLDKGTTNDDYSNDVMARAQFLISKQIW